MTQQKIKKILVLGLGRVGALVGTLLFETKYDVTGIDEKIREDFSFSTIAMGLSDLSELGKIISDYDAVVSCLPFFLNKDIAKLACDNKVHYFDLTEDVPTTNYILELSKTADCVMAPQCGLAPGVIGIIGASLTKGFKEIRHIKLRVGALPQHPTGLLGYAFNWSPAGVINEYLNDCEVIEGGTRKLVSPLEWKETIFINGRELEAMTTSGGLGTMCETYLGKAKNLDYKSIRYPGHTKLMNFLLHELRLGQDPDNIANILVDAKPPVAEDIVYIHASVEGINKEDRLFRDEFINGYLPMEINGREWRAISWTTAASVCAVIEMIDNGDLPDKGFIKQEDISFDKFLKTKNGGLYARQEK